MTNLEDKILKKVYVFETKQTIIDGLVKLVFYALLAGFVLLTGQAIYEILIEEGAFDLFQIIQEDTEVVKMYVWDTMYVFYQEIPKELALLFLTGVIILGVSAIIIIKHSGVIKNKIKALFRFWRKL